MRKDEWRFVGSRITFRAIPHTDVVGWIASLRGKSRGRFEAAICIVDRMLVAGAGSGGRLSKVHGSTAGLLLLRVTRSGDSSPHLRVFCLRRGDVIWLVHGFEQKTRKLPEAETRCAERLVQEFLDRERRTAPSARGRAP
jgi:hypothetical protein